MTKDETKPWEELVIELSLVIYEFNCTVLRQFNVHSGAREQFSPPDHSRQSAIE